MHKRLPVSYKLFVDKYIHSNELQFHLLLLYVFGIFRIFVFRVRDALCAHENDANSRYRKFRSSTKHRGWLPNAQYLLYAWINIVWWCIGHYIQLMVRICSQLPWNARNFADMQNTFLLALSSETRKKREKIYYAAMSGVSFMPPCKKKVESIQQWAINNSLCSIVWVDEW